MTTRAKKECLIRALGLLFMVWWCVNLASGKEYTTIDIVGDSISSGENPELGPRSGWVQMLYGELATTTRTVDQLWPGIHKYNSAVSGSRAATWATEPGEPLARVLGHRPDLVIIFIGGNDIMHCLRDGRVSDDELKEYRRNLTTIVERLQRNTPVPDIVLVNYFDLFDGCSEKLPLLFSRYRVMSQITREGNRIIREVAEAKGCYLVDSIYSGFMHHCYGEALGDPHHEPPNCFLMPIMRFNHHPVTAGHAIIHCSVFQMLEQLKGNGQ